MSKPDQRRILDAGDSAFIVEFGKDIDAGLLARVEAFNRHLGRLKQAGELEGLLETVPTFRSLAVIFDPLVTTPDDILALADASPMDSHGTQDDSAREWQLPVLYGSRGGPDLEDVSKRTSLSIDEVVSRHQANTYHAYMLGFQPGFAFLGDLPDSLRLARRDQPRVRVPRGSVAIANQLTAVYPWESPGGWHLIGYCPVPLFDALWSSPTLLRAGDLVRFKAIDQQQLSSIESTIDAGEFDVESLRAR